MHVFFLAEAEVVHEVGAEAAVGLVVLLAKGAGTREVGHDSPGIRAAGIKDHGDGLAGPFDVDSILGRVWGNAADVLVVAAVRELAESVEDAGSRVLRGRSIDGSQCLMMLRGDIDDGLSEGLGPMVGNALDGARDRDRLGGRPANYGRGESSNGRQGHEVERELHGGSRDGEK